MMTKFMWIKRKPLATITICAIIMAASIVSWPKSQVAEAAIINPHPGLVGWWRFDEATGTTAGDSSGHGNDGTISGAGWVDGKYGKALSFDGIDDYVDSGNNVSLNIVDAITIEAWIYPAIIDATQTAVSKNYQYDLNFGWVSGKLYLCLVIGGAWKGVVSDSAVLIANTWQHVVGTYDKNAGANNFKVYYNGVLAGQTTQAGAIDAFTGNVNVGAYNAASQWFTGKIDEVRIYNRALSATEIQEIFQKRPDFSSKLLAKVPKGTTQVIVTVSWQGVGTINAIMESPSKIYTESNVSSFYQKNVYSITGNTSDMLNIKRFSVLVSALSSDENWYIVLTFDNVEDYRIIIEVQK